MDVSLSVREKGMFDWLIANQTELPQAVTLHRLTLAGLINGSDVYVADAETRDHPFSDAFQKHPYLSKLGSLGGFTITMKSNGGYTTSTDASNPAMGTPISKRIDLPALTEYQTETKTYDFSPETAWNSFNLKPNDGRWTMSATQTASGFQLVSNIPTSRSGDKWFIGPSYMNQKSNVQEIAKEGKFTIPSCLAATDKWMTWVKEQAQSYFKGPIDLTTCDLDLGAHVASQSHDLSIESETLAGYHRIIFAQSVPTVLRASTQTYVLRTMTFYKWGNEPDVLIVGGVGHLEKREDPGLSASFQFQMKTSTSQATSTVGVRGVTQTRLYPLNGASMFVNGYYGIASPVTELGSVSYGGMAIVIREQTINVTSVRGHISVNEMRDYFSTGYGLFKPLEGDALTKTLESWQSYLDTGIVFGIQPGKASGYSLKTLPFYNEYARARKKACRDNNYMDLKYNAEYTNKQVEALLAAASSLDVWCTNAALASTKPVTSTFSRTVLQVITVELAGSTFYSVQFPGELNPRRYAFNAEGAQTLLTDIIENDFGIKDTTGTLDNIIGLDDDGKALSEYDTGSQSTSTNTFDMRMSSYNMGSAITAEDLEKQAGRVAATAYVAQQLTTFRHIRTNIPYLLSEFTFEKVWGTKIKL